MAILRIDIERALDEIISQEEGMRFQGLAVVLGKKRWRELIAHPRKKDSGLDAYAPASQTSERIGKGLAASITPNLRKISADATTAKENYPDLKMLLFVTAAKVGIATQGKWKEEIQKDHDLELHVIEREEIIALMILQENASLCASFLHLPLASEPQVADIIDRTRRAAASVAGAWAGKTQGHPLVDLTAVRLDSNGAESTDALSFEQIDHVLSQSYRIVLEGPAGCGKTTTLIQLAQRTRTAGTPFMVDLPAWTSSRRGILEYIAGMPAFQAEGLTAADLAHLQKAEPFLFLLNGWNEIAESNSEQGNHALRELERDFPAAGIIVATRTHHLKPPLPGALRLRLMHLQRVQRAAYLEARLGTKSAELAARIDGDLSLDELTRTPFVLSEVVSLFEADAEIPSTKVGILDQVIRLQEGREEHHNALQAAPIFGRQTDYLSALATAMTHSGAVALPEADARAIVANVAQELVNSGQIETAGAPTILATLTAHHVLERVDYPQTSFRFDHQQLQEYFAALDIHAQLLDLNDDDSDATGRFTADYVNDPAWAEPLRMIAATSSETSGNGGVDKRHTCAGRNLVEMALAVDLVFAGELAQLCGTTVWNEVRTAVGDRFRAVHAIRDNNYRQYAVAAMLATDVADFTDIIVPLLSDKDDQTRLSTYRLWPDIRVSSLGPSWRDQVRSWSEEARGDFVSELLHHRIDGEVADFAVEDNSIAVKKAAVSGLMWNRSDDALTRVLESMDVQTFEAVARENADLMPTALRSKTVAAMHRFMEASTDRPARLRTALDLVELGETELDGVIKDAMKALSSADMRNWGSHHIQLALKHLRNTDPAWVSEWVATQVSEGVLDGHEYWLPYATAIPDDLVEKNLQRLKTEDLNNARFEGMIAVIAARADAKLAACVFAELRRLWRKVDASPGQRHEFEWQVIRQLQAVFRSLPHDVAAAGVMSSVTDGDPLDIIVAVRLLNRVARTGEEPLRVTDGALKPCLRAYLKGGVGLVLRQDDFSGAEKANLASSIAQVGEPEDMVDLVTLIRADIDRVRRGLAALAAGDHGPRGHDARTTYARWNIAAVIHLDPVGAEQVLIDLLPEPEYRTAAAAAMAHDFLKKPQHFFDAMFHYDLTRAVREGRALPAGGDQRRTRFGAALKSEIKRLREQHEDGKSAAGLKELAAALAAIDGRGSAAVVLDVISIPDKWDQYTPLAAAERLLMAGVVLPATTAFALLDSILERTAQGMQDSDWVLNGILALCPFVDDPAAGIAKVRDVLSEKRLRGYKLRGLVTALGESRSDAAFDLLYELASDAPTFEQCEEKVLNAVAAFDTPRARELLLGFVDPDICGITLKRRPDREGVLVARLTELAHRRPEAAARLRELCERDLPELNRCILSKVMDSLGTPEALAANLNLIDDDKHSPVPQGIWDQLETSFIERRPHGNNPNVFTEHARASNELRVRLFRMALQDPKRRKSAFALLGEIEVWRLEHGRPTGEPRHPDLGSRQSWPPAEP